MSPDDIKKTREILGRYFRNEIDLITLAMAASTGWPEALDEVERLQRIENTVCEQMGKLRAVAEAAKDCAKVGGTPTTIRKLCIALTALEDG